MFQPAKTWPLRCEECDQQIQIFFPADTETMQTGRIECRGGHILLFHFEGSSLVMDEILDEA